MRLLHQRESRSVESAEHRHSQYTRDQPCTPFYTQSALMQFHAKMTTCAFSGCVTSRVHFPQLWMHHNAWLTSVNSSGSPHKCIALTSCRNFHVKLVFMGSFTHINLVPQHNKKLVYVFMCMHKCQVSQSRGLHLKTSIQCYFEPVNCLPDSRRQLSQSIPSATTAEANWPMQ